MGVQVNPFRFGGTSLTDSFVGSFESTLNASTYTFTNADIGNANASRVVAVGVVIYDTSANGLTSVTIGGNAATKAIDTSTAGDVGTGRVAGIYYLVVAAGTTATIVVNTSAAAQSCGVAVWALYPASSTPVDAVALELNTNASVTANNVAVTAGGTMVAIHQHDNAQSTNWAWTGVDPVTEELDQQLGDSGKIWSAATVRCTASSTTDDLQAAPSTGTPNLSIAAASWGP